MLYNWENKGLNYCQAKLTMHYPNEKGYLRYKSTPAFENVLHGKILFLGMVRGNKEYLFVPFLNKFKELQNR